MENTTGLKILSGTALVMATGTAFLAASLFDPPVAQPDIQGAWQSRLNIHSTAQSPASYYVEVEPVLNVLRTNGGYQAAVDFIGAAEADCKAGISLENRHRLLDLS